MPGLTHAQLRSLLKANLHKDTGYSDPDDLNTFLTLGQERIISDSPHTLGVKTDTITSANGTQEYDLAADFYQIIKMWDATNSRQVHPWTPQEWIQNVESLESIPAGIPRRYCITEFSESSNLWKVRFYPTPGGTYSLKNFYNWQPSAIASTGTPAICRIGFSGLLISAASFIALQRNDPSGSKGWLEQYLIELREYKTYNPQKPDDSSMLATQAYGGRGGSTLRLPEEFPG